MPRLRRAAVLTVPVAAAVYLYYNASTLPSFLQTTTPAQSVVADDVSNVPLSFTRKLVAVGDLHGDMPNARKALELAGVVDKDGKWSGNVDYFVQTGDIVDRGDDTIAIYDWMDALRIEAYNAGGVLLSHMGNHEFMNAIGDWRYVPHSEIASFGGVAERQRMLSTGRIGSTWAGNYTVASRVPLHPSLGPPNTDYPFRAQMLNTPAPLSHAALSFVHGGLSPTYSALTPFPGHINLLGKTLLKKLQRRSPPPAPHPPGAYPGLPADATPEEDELYGADGPLWYRGWALDDEKTVCAAVDGVLQKTGTRRMIMGHTPDFEKIVSRCGGKIIIIDTGICHAYGGVLSALSITYTLSPVDPQNADGPDSEWKEREVVTALYVDRQEVLAVDERVIKGNFALYHHQK